MNDPQTAYEWFARSVTEYGHDVTALEVEDARLTYGELHDLAERLAAHVIAAAGGTPPRRVGLLTGRTVTAYAGYLAVLRAGATVVPLNPEHPQARLAGIAASAGLDMVLADGAGSEVDLGVPMLVVESADLAVLAKEPTPELPYPPAAPDDVAYIIFTSGSTGVPKGVPILHRNLAAYLGQVASRYDVGPGSRLSQNFELTFDGSVHNMFVAWAGGGTLVVVQRSQLLSPVQTVNRLGLTHWFSVPSLITFASTLGTLTPGSMPTLRWSIFAGEAVMLDSAREWQVAASSGRIEVLYGLTELTITCTWYRFSADPAEWPETPNGTAPIGYFYPNADFVILDEDERPSDNGELCVRGPLRFPGYDDPANNAGRFLTPDQRPADENALTEHDWLRTGDRVLMRDGCLIHLGRTDHQVKVRGHRIELGEIEAALRRMPGVRDAVVLPVPTSDGQSELEAAISGAGCAPGTMYAALGDRLPPYMVPRRITLLDRMPLNVNGKIDRKALLAELGSSR